MSSSVDDDEFYEYNPHPYKGGYDIALTYGRPLPPSPSTCYPLSHPPTPPSPKPPIIQAPIPTSPPRSSSDYGESGHLHVSTSMYDGVFGFWPLSAEESRRCGADVEVEGYWNQLKRAGDYLFGYSEGYGERRVNENSYGIPVYANMTEGCPSISCQLQPAVDYEVDYVDNNRSLFSDDTNYKSYGCAYNEHYYEQPIHVVENLNEADLQLKLTYHEVHEDIADDTCSKIKWWDSYYEADNSYCVAYDNHGYDEMPLYVDQNLIEPTLYHQFSYPEVHEMQVSPELEWTTYLENIDKSYLHGNKQHDAEDDNHVELEPYKPTWSQYHYHPEIYVGNSCHEFNYIIRQGYGHSLEEYNDAYIKSFAQLLRLYALYIDMDSNQNHYNPYVQKGCESSSGNQR